MRGGGRGRFQTLLPHPGWIDSDGGWDRETSPSRHVGEPICGVAVVADYQPHQEAA
jgi:hypothetical protein